jgi:putative heme-binding domain-containing protein
VASNAPISTPFMHVKICFALVAALAPACLSHAARQVELNGHHFTLPDGFTIEIAADSSVAPRPIIGDFDPKGRLYIADSSGSNDRVETQLAQKPHRILRLEDSDGDGKFDKQTVFADRMMFPEGVLYYDGAVYVGAPPTIWKLEDKDGDGVAETRSEWFKEAALSGCANEIHGPYAGPDGYIYWCKGGFSKLNLEVPGKKPISDRAAHILRARPDGTGLESFMSGGMDNPVEIAFTPAGEAIFTTTFYTNPEGGKRDGLVHAVYGGVYPKVHDVIDGLKRTGDLLPILTHLGPAAPSGLVRYSSKVFGPEYQNNLFSTSFNLHKVFRHVLTPKGGTFSSQDADFVVSDNVDFHPTDVLEDADGSLLIVDTGGWYKLCCPTSQLAKPDVLGCIYRVRRSSAPKVDDPWGKELNLATATPAELAKSLSDSRPKVRAEAVFQLGKRGLAATAELRKSAEEGKTPAGRRNALRALTRVDSPDARAAVRQALADPDSSVRQTAARSAGLWRDADAFNGLIQQLNSSSEHVIRTAAAALGRLGNPDAVPALLQAASVPRERMLEHSIIFALIEINSPGKTRAGLEVSSPGAQRAALIALDQMDATDLRPEEVSRWLPSQEPVLRETAMWVALRHPEWAANFAEYFRTLLYDARLSPEKSKALQSQLASFANEGAIQEILVSAISRNETPLPNRLLALRAAADSNLRQMPEPWGPVFQDLLKSPETELRKQAILVASGLAAAKGQPSPLAPELIKAAEDEKLDRGLRLKALEAAGSHGKLGPDLFQFLIESVAASVPPHERLAAASIISRSSLSGDQLAKVANALQHAGPLEITSLLGAFEKSASLENGKLLMTALSSAKSFPAIRPETLKAKLAKFPPEIQQQGETLIEQNHQGLKEQQAKLENLSKSLVTGDIRRGQAIFHSAALACSGCHAVGYVGGNVGPDLTRVGAIRTEKDLLESIAFPSASFVRSFEPMLIQTKDGELHNGVVRRETPDAITLAAGPGAEEQIRRGEIVEMRPGAASVMPEGLDLQLSKQQLSDLVAFLKSLK